jgi:hypothetical protein
LLSGTIGTFDGMFSIGYLSPKKASLLAKIKADSGEAVEIANSSKGQYWNAKKYTDHLRYVRDVTGQKMSSDYISETSKWMAKGTGKSISDAAKTDIKILDWGVFGVGTSAVKTTVKKAILGPLSE